MNKGLVEIVIPIYQTNLTVDELHALRQVVHVLAAHPIVFAHPIGLNVGSLQKEFPTIGRESFPDYYFAGIAGYNRLMMSTEFYERFLNFDYILIYQLDAYVFVDRLSEWCIRGYDYVGAPWLLKKKYDSSLWKPILALKTLWYQIKGRPLRPKILGNKVGNGGLSLRKVTTHLAVAVQKQSIIVDFLEQSKIYTEYNEDVFWATQTPDFCFPTKEEAATFSLDLHPERGFELNNGQLPFGCHGWSQPSRRKFWERYIF